VQAIPIKIRAASDMRLRVSAMHARRFR